jgi:hypothetical protein
MKIIASMLLLLSLAGCSSHHGEPVCVGREDFKEGGSVECVNPGDPRYTPFDRQRQQGSGMGMYPHLRLGPNGNRTVIRPDPVLPYSPPPLNNGQAGVPIDIPPDDPGVPEQPDSDFDVNIVFVNQTSSEKAKYNAVASMLESIVPTAAFKSEVLSHRSCNGSIGYYGTSSELGNVNQAVYDHIRNGNETKPNATSVDRQMDMKVEMYRDDASTTIGYTYATSDQIWVNRKYSDGYKPSSLGGNLFHEWLHKMGYGHSSASTSCRPYSIPYAIGYMARDFMIPLNDDYGY